MGVPEFLIGFAVFVGGVLFTAGYGAVSVTPADFKKARVCFYLAALCAEGAVVVWGLTAIQPFWARLFVTCVTGAVILGGLTEGLRWLEHRENPKPAEAPVSPTPQQNEVAKTSDIKPTPVPTLIRFQFKGGKQASTAVRTENILHWYVLCGNETTITALDKHNKPLEHAVFPVTWTIILVFDVPVTMKQLLVEPGGSDFPTAEVKIVTPWYAVITTFGADPPAGLLDIYSKN